MTPIVVGLAWGLTAGTAFAQSSAPGAGPHQPPSGKPPIAFAALDVDADGKIDRNEAKADALLAQNFVVLDTDKNGSLSETEFAASTNVVGSASP